MLAQQQQQCDGNEGRKSAKLKLKFHSTAAAAAASTGSCCCWSLRKGAIEVGVAKMFV